jgi:CRP-like cAMP-binding protein
LIQVNGGDVLPWAGNSCEDSKLIGQHLRAAKLPIVSLEYRRDEVVYERGAPAQFIYVVTKGTLCRLRVLADGRRLILQFLFPGDVFGYEQGRHHHHTVQALTKDTRALSAGRETLLEASKSDAQLSHFLFTEAARAEAVAREHSAVLLGRSTTEQLALFLLEMDARISRRGEIALPMRRQHIADYLGRRVESVSRTFTAFHKAKIIEFLGNPKIQRQVVIRDKRRLERLASDASDFRWWEPSECEKAPLLGRAGLRDASRRGPQ